MLLTHFFGLICYLGQLPSQCICPYFVHTAVLIARATIDKLLVVAPNVAPPVPKCALYTAIMAASSVRVRTSMTILPTMAQGLNEQQGFI